MSLTTNKQLLSKAIQQHNAGNIADAKKIYTLILHTEPEHSDTLHLNSIAHCQEKNFSAAEHYITKARKINPTATNYILSEANIYFAQKKLTSALFSYNQVLKNHPQHAEALLGCGNVYDLQGDIVIASSYYQQAILSKPNLIAAHNNLGNLYRKLGQLLKARQTYKVALQLCNNNDSDILKNLGMLYIEQGLLNKACTYLAKSIQLRPTTECLAQYYSVLKNLAQWPTAKLVHQQLEEKNDFGETPLLNILRIADPKINFQIASKWSKSLLQQKSICRIEKKFVPQQKIRIGYLSRDFFDHATSHLISHLFEYHDRSKFETYVYSYGPDDQSIYRKTIKENSDSFIDLETYTNKQCAEKISSDKIDILIDLKLYTLGARPEICLQKPAPILIHYLGFPGTSGNPCYDYMITDQIVTPKEHLEFYSEKCIFMPHCYQFNDLKNTPVTTTACKHYTRADFNLPEDSIVFCSFNQIQKLSQYNFELWLKILSAIPNSILWLNPCADSTQEKLKLHAKKFNLDTARIIFAVKLPKAEHLNRLALADIALDTFTCNGHTTTSDALIANLPVITLQGKHFASRVASSILQALGLPELITTSTSEYLNKALQLAENQAMLKNIKEKIKHNKINYPLFNGADFVASLEYAYTQIWQAYMEQQEPQHLYIT